MGKGKGAAAPTVKCPCADLTGHATAGSPAFPAPCGCDPWLLWHQAAGSVPVTTCTAHRRPHAALHTPQTTASPTRGRTHAPQPQANEDPRDPDTSPPPAPPAPPHSYRQMPALYVRPWGCAPVPDYVFPARVGVWLTGGCRPGSDGRLRFVAAAPLAQCVSGDGAHTAVCSPDRDLDNVP